MFPGGRLAAIAGLCAMAATGMGYAAETTGPAAPSEIQIAQSPSSCKQVSSCEEAVIMWCNGYSRADGDKDGIPCENVCPSKQLVDQIRAQIGC